MGEFAPKGTPKPMATEFDGEVLVTTVESITGIQRQEFCSRARSALVVAARETLVLSGRRVGATTTMLARLAGLDTACIRRRHDAAVRKMKDDRAFSDTITRVIEAYQRNANRV